MGRVAGQGKYTWANGDIYDGQWQQGTKSGHGSWTSKEKGD